MNIRLGVFLICVLVLGAAFAIIVTYPAGDAGADAGDITIHIKLEGDRTTPQMQSIPVTVKFWSPDTVIAEGSFPSGGSVLYTFSGTTTNWNSGSKATDFIIYFTSTTI